MPRFNLTVRREKINQEEAHTRREHFSEQPEDGFMSDGGETFGKTGLGYQEPDTMRAWTVEYSKDLQGRYGTIEQILFASRKGVFQRAVVSLCIKGTVDLVIRDGKVEDGPSWATMQREIALITLRQSVGRGLRQVMQKLPKAAASCIQTLLDEADKLNA